MVAGIAVGLGHAVAGGEVEPLIVIASVVVVDTADIEQGDGSEPTIAAQLQPALLRALDGTQIADYPIGDVVEVLVVAADELVQV